ATGGIAFLLAASGQANAQTQAQAQAQTGGSTVRLEDVVASALTRMNPMVQRDNERVNRAAGQLQQASGAFDWNATAQSGWEELFVPKERNGFLTKDVDEKQSWHTIVGLSRRLRDGITIQPGISFYSTSATEGQTFGLTRPKPALNLTVPLFRGFG